MKGVLCERKERRAYYSVGNTQYLHRKDFIRDITQNAHITDKSPLLNINIGLVSQFVLDPMHMIHLGVMKRLLLSYWIEGKRPYKLSRLSITNINHCLKRIRKYIPQEFHRKIRTLADVKRYKAPEYRFFLLYCGPLILKNNLSEDRYKHFILFHCASFIFSSELFAKKYCLDAKDALQKFITLCPKVYDMFFVVYNVHSLLHIHEDVKKFGPMETYPFESYLGQLKNRVRGKYLPLQQIAKRLHEIQRLVRAK